MRFQQHRDTSCHQVFFPLQGKAPKEIHAILTGTLGYFFPGRAKDLSTTLYYVGYNSELRDCRLSSCFPLWRSVNASFLWWVPIRKWVYMAYRVVTKGPTVVVIVWKEFVAESLWSLPSVEQNIDGCKLVTRCKKMWRGDWHHRTSTSIRREAERSLPSALQAFIVCPTRYRIRHFFNNSNTNEDIATKFEQ